MLEKSLLLEIEATFCDPMKRKTWCVLGSVPAASLGRMLSDLINYCGCNRTQVHEALERFCTDKKTKHKLGVFNTFNSFLNGKSQASSDLTTEKWVEFSKLALNILLVGSATGEPFRPAPESQEIVGRIRHFFFPDTTANLLGGIREDVDRQKTWFFDPRLNGFSNPATGREVWASLRRILWLVQQAEQGKQKDCVIFRVASANKFYQLDDKGDSLTCSGKLSVACLLEGVKLYYIYPAESKAAESAEKILELSLEHASTESENQTTDSESMIRSNLNLVPVNLEALAMIDTEAGEYFSKQFNYALYEASSEKLVKSERTYLIMRDPSFGTSAFVPSAEEIAFFSEWCSMIVEKFG